MDVVFREEALGNPKLSRVRPHPGYGGLHGFLHHLTDLTGHVEPAFALHAIGFDEQDVAARWRPSQPNDYASALGAFGDFAFATNLDATEKLLHHFFDDHQAVVFALSQTPRLLAADGSDIAFQIANPGFARVVADHVAHAFLRKLDLIGRDAVLVYLPWNQILERNVNFLLFCVALQLDGFHAVAQWFGDRVEHICGCDEEDFRQIERHIQIVIPESRILLWIERFQQRRRGVTAKIAPDFVDFIEHENWIFGFRAANSLDDLPRQRADIGAPMTAN